jgi:hypothetical protein
VGVIRSVVGLLVACAGTADPAGDRARYLGVLREPRGPTGERLARCAQIGDRDLRGDCALAVAQQEGRRPDGAIERICPEVPDGVWQHECWFLAAEAARRRGQEDAAVELCVRSGPFTEDCAQHLWQGEVHRLIHDRGPVAFGLQLPAARRAHDAWAARLGAGEAFSSRFWAKYYQNGFEGVGARVDLGACAPLPEADAARCASAAVELYARELRPRAEREGVDLCRRPPWTSAELERVVPCAPDPRLDAVLAEICAGSAGADR